MNVEIKIANRFELMIRVFQLKFKKLMKNFIEKHVLEKMKTHIYVIEFQKKKLFHAHILLIKNSKNDVTAINVDVVVQVIISDSIAESEFYKLMTKHMIHKNCKNKIDVICHDKNDNCIKNYSKSMFNVTNFFHFSDYFQYRRSNKKRISDTI